jgi:hypothetical protein
MLRLLLLSLPIVLLAQPKQADPRNGPRVVVAVPLGATPGSTSKLTLRGLRLDNATEVRLTGSKGTVKLIKKGKTGVPNMQKPEKVGDSEVQIELTLPADAPEGTLAVEVVTPAGTTSHKLLIARGVIAEKEPNNGYREAQPLTLPAIVDGAISAPQDVDVFRIEGKAGQKLVAEVLADRHGSALDGILTLADARGAILTTNDDAVGADPKIEFTLPRDGVYYLSLIDAHDQGGPAHVYRLVVR